MNTPMTPPIPSIAFKPLRALISVSDQRGIVELGQALHQNHVEIIATGNTAQLLKQHALPVTDIEEYTGFPELLNGRVKTLHPAIHAALLSRGNQDNKTLEPLGIKPIDLLIVNLRPFEQIISQPDCDFNTAIEHIDIGGPAMIRAAAKNHVHTFVVVTPDDYPDLTRYLHRGKVPFQWNFRLAKKAFSHIAAYDAAIANYLATLDTHYVPSGFPDVLTCQFNQISELQYGENPHQQAIYYADKNTLPGSLGSSTLLQGKKLSYNNLLDAESALDCVKSFGTESPVCVIVKQTHLCGVAAGDTLTHAYLKAFNADPISAFGGVIAFNHTIDKETATTLLTQQSIEVIIAPDVSKEAKKILRTQENIRILLTGEWHSNNQFRLDMKKVDGGLLVQEHDSISLIQNNLKIVTTRKPGKKQIDDLIFAWHIAKHVKSHAIVYCKDKTTVGIGGGQPSRLMSARIGLWHAEQMKLNTKGAVMASDTFIPFTDTIEIAAQVGISAIIQPGGSTQDEQIIACANQFNIGMILTGVPHLKN